VPKWGPMAIIRRYLRLSPTMFFAFFFFCRFYFLIGVVDASTMAV